MDGIRRGGVDYIAGEEHEEDNGGEDESSLDDELAGASQETSSTATLGDSLTVGIGIETDTARCQSRRSRIAGADLAAENAALSLSQSGSVGGTSRRGRCSIRVLELLGSDLVVEGREGFGARHGCRLL